MDLYKICVLLSSFFFLAYVISYFSSPHMKSEFKRFKLEKLGLLTINLQFLGALGLLVGLLLKTVMIISSAGLALLMFFAFLIRIKLKDGIWASFPALFFMILNLYILLKTINA